MLEIQEVTNQYSAKKWDSCVKSLHGSFLQSWDWGLLQEQRGKKVWRVIITEKNDDNLQEYPFLIYQEQLPGGFNWLYVPQIYTENKLVVEALLDFVEKYAKHERSLFMYVDPRFENQQKIYFEFGFKLRKNASIQPLDTIILPILSDEKMLSDMHKKTRYNIRLAEKKGVTVKIGKSKSDMGNFYSLVQKTENRQGIDSHSQKYYEDLLKLDSMFLVLAEYDGKVIAGNILSIYGNSCVYLHGASDYEYRKVMAPVLLQWKCILFAREQGCEYYDFWGIKGRSKNTKNWGGITAFKSGFTSGKYTVHYAGLFIKVMRPMFYYLYRVLRPLRKFVH